MRRIPQQLDVAGNGCGTLETRTESRTGRCERLSAVRRIYSVKWVSPAPATAGIELTAHFSVKNKCPEGRSICDFRAAPFCDVPGLLVII